MTTHPKREYTPEQIESMANSLLKIPTSFGKEPLQAALMLRSLASQLDAQKREGDLTAVSREEIEVAIKAQKWLGEFFTPESPHYGISKATQKIFKKMLAQYSYKVTQTMPPRFFMSHGTIHDRVTGRHVTCEPDAQNLGDCNGTGEDVILKNPDGITATLSLLNELHRAATPTPPKSASVPVERLEALLSQRDKYSTGEFGETVEEELAELIAEYK
jgi:hypothetical protein